MEIDHEKERKKKIYNGHSAPLERLSWKRRRRRASSSFL
jgi:hypothetical protein